MSRMLQALLVLALLLAGLQWGIPRWVGQQVARQLAQVDGGVTPTVEVTAIPFWTLASGRFQDLYINARQLTLAGVAVQGVTMNWADGQVSMAGLLHHQLDIKRPGHVSLQVALSGTSLSHVLAQGHTLASPSVTIRPSGITVSGRILVGGVYFPLTATGNLFVSPNQEQLIFRATQIDGIHLPVLTEMQLVNLANLKLPLPLAIDQVTETSSNTIVIKAGSP